MSGIFYGVILSIVGAAVFLLVMGLSMTILRIRGGERLSPGAAVYLSGPARS